MNKNRLLQKIGLDTAENGPPKVTTRKSKLVTRITRKEIYA